MIPLSTSIHTIVQLPPDKHQQLYPAAREEAKKAGINESVTEMCIRAIDEYFQNPVSWPGKKSKVVNLERYCYRCQLTCDVCKFNQEKK
jgi:hypothetical protein